MYTDPFMIMLIIKAYISLSIRLVNDDDSKSILLLLQFALEECPVDRTKELNTVAISTDEHTQHISQLFFIGRFLLWQRFEQLESGLGIVLEVFAEVERVIIVCAIPF